jgi:LCP family protein required for cell wall assembly
MSWFKTKKLPKHVTEAAHQQKTPPEKQENPIHEIEDVSDILEPRAYHFPIKSFLYFLGGMITLFIISQIGIHAFRDNRKNGSENAKLPSIVEEFRTQKIAGTVNILIAWIGGKWHEWSDLTDSLMLASLDGTKNEITLLSIPRDLYVAYPKNLGWAGRINSLYALWKRDNLGIEYLASKVSEITGQSIDHYIVIDFTGFKQVVDILGGISVEVPEDLIDREYPDNNWWYETFTVRRWPQIFDGDTALKYARSRHSTSDFDRSERQQLIIKSIKEKASDLGIITNFDRLGELYDTIFAHLDTDMTLAKLSEIALSFSDVPSENIGIVNLSDVCLSVTKCQPGAYLYAPSRDLFSGNAVMIPENALAHRLSYYTDIRRFVDLTFRFPTLRNNPRSVVLVHDPSMKRRAQEIGLWLAKLGFPISWEKSITTSTGTIEKSHINIYWHEELGVGIDPKGVLISASKYIEDSIPYSIVTHNEYITSLWPKVEIVIGKDGDGYFRDIRAPYYLPVFSKTATGWTGSVGTGRTENPKTPPQKTKPTISWEAAPSVLSDGWENF